MNTFKNRHLLVFLKHLSLKMIGETSIFTLYYKSTDNRVYIIYYYIKIQNKKKPQLLYTKNINRMHIYIYKKKNQHTN